MGILRFRSPFFIDNSKNYIETDEEGNRYEPDYSGGSRYILDTFTTIGQLQALQLCAPLSGIIKRQSDQFINGRVFYLDAEGNEVNNYQTKQIKKLFSRPNPLQSWSQFMHQLKSYKAAFGEVLIKFVAPLNSTDKYSVGAMYIIPNWIWQVEETGKLFDQTSNEGIVKQYSMTFRGVKTILDSNFLIHIKGNVTSSENYLRGESPLIALKDPISNIIGAYESRGKGIKNRGAKGILSNDAKDGIGVPVWSQKTKDILQRAWRGYGGLEGQNDAIISEHNLKWTPITFPTRDLMLFEEIEDDVRQITDNLSYSMYLLGFKAGSTFNNVSEARRWTYENETIPESILIFESFNNFFETEKYGFKISVFYDHLDFMQKSEKEKAEALKIRTDAYAVALDRQAITVEEFRTLALDIDATIPAGTLYFPAAKNIQP